MLSGMTAFSQLKDGFYRVQNKGSERFLYVRDCTGEVSTLGVDLGAIELWPNIEDAISDPASVIYLKQVGSAYDLTAQGTGVYAISGRYMNISYDGKYAQVYNSGQYLYDAGNHTFNETRSILDAKTSKEMPGKTDYRLWIPKPIDNNTDNYFGFAPTIEAKGKYYCPFYAEFSYSPIEDSKTWYVNSIDKENAIVVIKEIQGMVAGSQPVIIECNSANPSDNKVILGHNEGQTAADNLLVGTYFDNWERSNTNHKGKNPAIITFNEKTMRILSTDTEGNLVYVNDSSLLPSYYVCIQNKWTKDVKCIPHNQSYLVVEEDYPTTLKVMTEDEYQKYIESTPVNYTKETKNTNYLYDMKGNMVVGNPCKGIYLRNNRKFVVSK